MITRFLSITFIFVITLSSSVTSLAQPNNKPQRNKQWISEVRAYKQNFLIKETEMTEEQQKVFIPLYNEMEEQIYKTNREARHIARQISTSQEKVTDEQYGKAAEVLSQVKGKVASIENKYFEEFSKILSKKQLFLLKRAENRFSIEMLNHNKRSKTTQQ